MTWCQKSKVGLVSKDTRQVPLPLAGIFCAGREREKSQKMKVTYFEYREEYERDVPC
mgnify:CR=1 FL=1